MKVSFITTVDHNVGDDFVRVGLKYLLKQYLNGKTLEFENIHKHSPITSRYGFEWCRRWRYSRRLDKLLPLRLTKDRILEADLVVQSGAPVYWCHTPVPHCYNNEWFGPLIRRRFSMNKQAKLLNLAAGSCQDYHDDGSGYCHDCNAYSKALFDQSTVTTVRDRVAQNVLAHIGLEAPVLPCSSIFAIDEFALQPQGDDYVVINYMPGGGHFIFGREIDFSHWEQTFKTFYHELKRKEKVIVVCHDKIELAAIRRIDPHAEVFYREHDYQAYMEFYSRAKFGITNRVHAALLMASFGKPAMVIGNDSRAKMVEEVGLKHYFVNDVDIDVLNTEYERLCSSVGDYPAYFQGIKQQAYAGYMQALSGL